MNPSNRFAAWTDRLTAATLVLLLTGTAAAFGGRVWWAPRFIGILCVSLVALGLTRSLLDGSVRLLRSPLTVLGLLALALATFQLTPLPGRVSTVIAPGARAVYATGYPPGRAQALDPTAELPPPRVVRAPASLDRPATLRWLVGAAGCLAVFWTASRFADCLNHLYVVWGAVLFGFFLNTAVGLVQLVCGPKARGAFGSIEPGLGPSWGPNLVDLADGPNATVLRATLPARDGHPFWALPVPDSPFLIGGQMGGPGAYLALATIALPLALALTLQILAPRGSREPLSIRLTQTGQGSLVALVFGLLLASAALVGLLAGPGYSIVFALGLLLVGVPSVWSNGLRWMGLGLTLATVIALTVGAAGGMIWSATSSPPPVAAGELTAATRIWRNALPIARDFPLVGTGLGSFATVYPFYKTHDPATNNAMSSLLQWWIESGIAGLALLGAGVLWCGWRLPGAIRNVGTADRALAFGLIGAAVAFTLFSAVHWTVELASVALAASALAGVGNRWLAGGTDLFVERV